LATSRAAGVPRVVRAHRHTSQVVARYRDEAFVDVWDPHPDGAFLAPPRGWAMFFV